jgi:excinuclease UvrABC nuclease subunit
MNPKHHLPKNEKIIQELLLLDTIHVHSQLDGLLLAKKSISNTEPKIFMCTTCYISIKNNKMPKLALANGLWIGNAPKMLPKMTMVKETLIARYRC